MSELSATDLRACQLCLDTDSKLFHVNKNGLAQILVDFTNIDITQMTGLPQYVCNICCSLLRKAIAFRNRCTEMQNFLHECSLVEPLTSDLIKTIERANFKLQLTKCNVLNISLNHYDNNCKGNDNLNNAGAVVMDDNMDTCVTDNSNNYVVIEPDNVDDDLKKHNNSTKSSLRKHNDNSISNDFNADCNVPNNKNVIGRDGNDNVNDDFKHEYDDLIDSDLIKIELDTVTNVNDNKLITEIENPIETILTVKLDKRKCRKNIAKVKENYSLTNIDKHVEIPNCVNKELFYNYISEKYINRSKDLNHILYDPLNSDDDKTDEYNNDCTRNNDINCHSVETKGHDTKNPFYKYIIKKYRTNDVTRENKKGKVIKPKEIRFDRQKCKKLEKFGKEYNFEVLVMSRAEQKSAVEERKLKANFVNAEFQCFACYRGFRNNKAFKSHLLVHDPSVGDHLCDMCQMRFPQRSKLVKHKRNHAMKFICRNCGAVLKNSTEAKQHYHTHAGMKYDCEHCGKTFRRYRSRVEHIRIHHGSTICDICYKGLANPAAVQGHKTSAHREVFSCDTCQVKFAKKTALTLHITSLRGSSCAYDVRPCSACGVNFESDSQLQAHIVTDHPQVRPGANSIRKRKCCPCGHIKKHKTKDNPNSITINSTTKYGNTEHNPFEMPIDNGKINNDGENLEIVGHTKKVKLKNDVDLESTKVHNNLDSQSTEELISCDCPCKVKKHNEGMRKREAVKETNSDDEVVTKKQKFMCEVCALKNFQSIATLRAHQMIHTGEKPYQCQICSKSFRLKCLLQMHMPVHTNERAYPCGNCDKSFKTASARNRHQLVHTGIRRHRCSVCHKRFQTTSCLKTHVKTVHMKIPYPPCRASRRARLE